MCPFSPVPDGETEAQKGNVSCSSSPDSEWMGRELSPRLCAQSVCAASGEPGRVGQMCGTHEYRRAPKSAHSRTGDWRQVPFLGVLSGVHCVPEIRVSWALKRKGFWKLLEKSLGI